jgi:hypothetical protein
VLDSGQKRSGTQSMRIKKIGPEPYGTISQILDGTRYAGKTVRLSGWIRTDAVPEGRNTGAGLVLLALRGSSFVAHEVMKKARVRGTTEWKRYTIELKVPPGRRASSSARRSRAPAPCGSTTSSWRSSSRERVVPVGAARAAGARRCGPALPRRRA